MTVQVESWPHDQAVELSAGHVEITGHHITVYACMCGQPIGLICDNCTDFVIAIASACCATG